MRRRGPEGEIEGETERMRLGFWQMGLCGLSIIAFFISDPQRVKNLTYPHPASFRPRPILPVGEKCSPSPLLKVGPAGIRSHGPCCHLDAILSILLDGGESNGYP